MKTSELTKIVDLMSFISLVLMVSSGLILEFMLPAGSGKSSLLGMTRHTWGSLHFYLSLLFLVMMASHLLLHLKYIKAVVSGKQSREKRYRIGVGLVGVVALLILATAPFFVPVDYVEKERKYRHHQPSQ